jgi:hypothetical protein
MDAGSLASLQRLIQMGARSLLQYFSESCPFASDQTRHELTHLMAAAEEERNAVSKLVRFLQKKHKQTAVLGNYPAYYTTLNYLTVDTLPPRLIEDDEKHLAELDKTLLTVSDEDVYHLIESYRDVKRRHLQSWKELAKPPERAAS